MKTVLVSCLLIASLSLYQVSAIEFTWTKEERRMVIPITRSERVDQRLRELDTKIKARTLKMHKLGLDIEGLYTGAVSPLYRGEDIDTTANGFTGYALGTIYGLQFNALAPSNCYVAFEQNLNIAAQIGALIEQIYLPQSWSLIGLAVEDSVVASAGITANCKLDQLGNQISVILSAEGASSLVARLGGGLLGEIPD